VTRTRPASRTRSAAGARSSCSRRRTRLRAPAASRSSKGDAAHAGFDNTTFISKNQITFVEDAGDTLHGQRNALDSGWLFNVNTDYSNAANQPIRWLAQGRDASATLDAANSGFGVNEGDNEITGAVVSNGDPGTNGILGAKAPKLWKDDWRFFYTQQHGDNPTYEVIPAEGDGPEGS
jgi:hypothetical protein